MSDGHYNRALLPHGGYASGLKMGRSAQLRECELALQEVLAELMPDDTALQERIMAAFRSRTRQ